METKVEIQVGPARAGSNLPGDCIRRWGCSMAAVVYAQLHCDRTIHDSIGFPCSHAYRCLDDSAFAEGRRHIHELRSDRHRKGAIDARLAGSSPRPKRSMR